MNKQAPLISVILPVYNAVDCLDITLQALLSQVEVSLEIVAVDDGSTDASGQMLDTYAARHTNIMVIHTANQGAGKARQEGLARARGDYIGFCDSGDEPDATLYATMLKRLSETDADMVACGFCRFDAKSGQAARAEMLGFAAEPYLIADDPGVLLAVNTALWNKLYKAELLDDAARGLALPRVAEDMVLQLLLYRGVQKVVFVNQALYRYRVTAGSLMSGATMADLEDLRASLCQVRELIVATSAATPQNHDILDICDLSAFIHLGLSLPLRLITTPSLSLSQALRQVRAMLKRDFPRSTTSQLGSLSAVLRHRGRNARLFVARLCQRLHLMLPLVGFLRL
ncbi:MAG: glycosyltransferase, partial [Coriobacteriales bacterium]|nr:glycosyltransferase [Coriobacteriales bacterium]